MVDLWKRLLVVGMAWCLVAQAQPQNGATTQPPQPPPVPPVKALLADEMNQLEREIAARMMHRPEFAGDKRGRLELEIDLRIIERAVIAGAAEAKFDSNEQAAAWLRARQLREAVHDMEEALGQQETPSAQSQKEAIGQIHKLSFNAGELKAGKDLDDFCRGMGLAMANAVNANHVEASSLAVVRPKPIASHEAHERPATVGELTEQVQKLAALSMPLRQQLLALSAAATAAGEKDEGRALYAILTQSIDLARGLQSNTAVGPEARLAIESQLAEGIALYSDPRTRGAGRARIEALGQYRQTLTRIGRLSLSREQTEQLAPAFAWAQANPEPGTKLLGMIEQYMDFCGRWDAMNRDVSVPTTLRRPMEDLRSQFAKARTGFMQSAAKMGGTGAMITLGEIEQQFEEIKRLFAVTDDVLAMGGSIETINAFKIKPVGALEKKIVMAALAASSPIQSVNRNDGQKYLSAVRALAKLAQALASKLLGDVPPAVAQAWAGAAIPVFENRWKAIVVDLAGALVTGTIELDRAKLGRLDNALALGDALRTAAQLEAALPKTAALAKWVDWAIDPGSLQLILTPYKEATAGAFLGYASDNLDQVDKWGRLQGRFSPLVTLILRDAAYAEACQDFPTGFSADVSRLATPFEGAPFATERYASYAIGVWATLERSGDLENADRMSILLAKRLARDLRMSHTIEDATLRAGKRLRP
jgi:hypothetical protein